MYYKECGAGQCGWLCGYERIAVRGRTGVGVLVVTTCGGGAECPKSAGIPRHAEAEQNELKPAQSFHRLLKLYSQVFLLSL